MKAGFQPHVLPSKKITHFYLEKANKIYISALEAKPVMESRDAHWKDSSGLDPSHIDANAAIDLPALRYISKSWSWIFPGRQVRSSKYRSSRSSSLQYKSKKQNF